MRVAKTPQEAALWKALQARRLYGFKFRAQHPLGPFILDFCCPAARLVVEVDGALHRPTAEQDAARTAQLADYGYHMVRFSNAQVEGDLPHVLDTIAEAVRQRIQPLKGDRPAENG